MLSEPGQRCIYNCERDYARNLKRIKELEAEIERLKADTAGYSKTDDSGDKDVK